jgi:hypothetical protein
MEYGICSVGSRYIMFLNCDPDAPLKDGCQWLYFIGESFPALKVPAVVKIGISSSVRQRLATFKTSNCRNLQIIYCRQVPTAASVEKWLHNRFWSKRIRGEWFEITLEDIMWFSELVIENEINVQSENYYGPLVCIGELRNPKNLLRQVTWHLVAVPKWLTTDPFWLKGRNVSLVSLGYSWNYAVGSVSGNIDKKLNGEKSRSVYVENVNGYPMARTHIDAGEYSYNDPPLKSTKEGIMRGQEFKRQGYDDCMYRNYEKILAGAQNVGRRMVASERAV